MARHRHHTVKRAEQRVARREAQRVADTDDVQARPGHDVGPGVGALVVDLQAPLLAVEQGQRAEIGVHVVADAGVGVGRLLGVAEVHHGGLRGLGAAVVVLEAGGGLEQVGEAGEDGPGDGVRGVKVAAEEVELGIETLGEGVGAADEVITGHLAWRSTCMLRR